MFKFVFYICVSTLVFCECSGFWFDLFDDVDDKNTVESSNEDYFDELVEWISKCFFGLDSETEKPNSVPPSGNLTDSAPVNTNLGSKNSSGTQKQNSASNLSPDGNSAKQTPQAVPQNAPDSSATNKDKTTEIKNPPAVPQSASESSATNKDNTTKIKNPPAVPQSASESSATNKDKNTEMQNPPAVPQSASESSATNKDNNTEIQNSPALTENSAKKEEITPNEETNTDTT